MDETYRVMGLVALTVTVGLTVAGFANGSANARSERAGPVQHARSGPDASGLSGPARETGVAPVRNVRMVYAGPIVANAGTGDETAPRRIESAVPSVKSEPRAERRNVDATGSVGAASSEAPVRMAAIDRAAPASQEPGQTAASPGLDLNTASVDELNALGAGRIGRAVARGRPYASPEDLLRKRIVNRATYARIKGQIAVE